MKILNLHKKNKQNLWSYKMVKQQTLLGLSLMLVSILAGCSSNAGSPEQVQQKQRLKPEVIKQEGKFGTIQEERVRAMSSEARYIPSGSQNGYTLVDPTLADSKENAHRDPQKPMIGSFTIGRW